METKKVEPLSRQDVEKLLATDADAFTVLRYLRHRENVPALAELEQKGQAQLPGIEGSMCDLYHALWNPEPRLKEKVAPDRQYWQGLLKQAMATSAYQETHSQTQLKDLLSIIGTVAMTESVMAMISKKDKKQLQELANSQAKADQLSEQAKEAQAESQATQKLAEAMAENAGQGKHQAGESQPFEKSGTGTMLSEEAKAIANEIAKQAVEVKTKAENLQKQASEAKAKSEALAEALMGKSGSQEAEQKLQELARIGLQAVRDAQTKVQEVSETIESWGLEEAELHRQGIPEALGLLEKMKRNKSLQKFAELLGRIRKIAARKAKSKIQGEGARITASETGRDIKRAKTSELVALTNPALRAKALNRWAKGELQLIGQETKQKLGHGPIIVCEDASGSMEGSKQQWAKAVTLSLAHYAKIQKRSFGWIMFDSRVQAAKTYSKGNIPAKEMLEIVESQAGGGTDFEKPLCRAMEMIQKEGLKKADICFITDGECAVSDEFIRELKAIKKALEINVVTILCDAGSSADKTVKDFSDRIEKASSFTAEEAETKIFRNL
ncbi:hypothetical protein KKB43_04740 [Patescibacteria group bacterium]|nr:hypothetical protein [Patescibacteria group bacterium]